jgi:hypothetical protein
VARTSKLPVATLGIGVGGGETKLDRWRLPQGALELFKHGRRTWFRRVTVRVVPGAGAGTVTALVPVGALVSNVRSPSKSQSILVIGVFASVGVDVDMSVTVVPAMTGLGAQSKSAVGWASAPFPQRGHDRADCRQTGREQKPDVTYPHPTNQRRRGDPASGTRPGRG